MKIGLIKETPLKDSVSAISCGIYNGSAVLDLDYDEDCVAETDANFVITGSGKIVEIQGTAEQEPFTEDEFMELLRHAQKGCKELTALQNGVIVK